MNSVADFLKRAADRNGFTRDRFDERRLPNDFTDICVMPFFGDYRSMMVMSSFLLHRFREEIKGSKYFILASWPGFQGLFPYVDEYWSFNDAAHLVSFYENSYGFKNKSELSTIYVRNLNEFFRDVVAPTEFDSIYHGGFTNKYFEKFVDVKRFMPFVPSGTILGKDFNRELSTRAGYKIFIYPSLFAKQWHIGKPNNIRIKKEFWIELCNFLLQHNYQPVVWQNSLSHDLSPDLTQRCIFVQETDMIRVLAAMRSTGFVLDVFNSISRFATLARCPYLAVDERARYQNVKEYEIDDLCENKYCDHIYTFSTLLSGTSASWSNDLFSCIVKRLDKMLPELNRENWTTTAESVLSLKYKDLVRKRAQKKLGTRFIKVNCE